MAECKGCGGPTNSAYGWCQRNPKCKGACNRARKQAQAERERESGHGRYSCLGCGCPVSPNHATGKATYTCRSCQRGLGRELAILLRDLAAA
jgi:hypothetical protein